MTTYTLDPLVVRGMLTQAAPGPWEIRYRDDAGDFHHHVQAAAGDLVADMPDEWMYDNASLIAAAPDLARDYLAVCTELAKLKAERDNGETHAFRLTHRPTDPTDPWSASVPQDVA